MASIADSRWVPLYNEVSELASHGPMAIIGACHAAQMEAKMEFTAVFEKVPEGYIGFVEELPGANTQGATLEETRDNLKEAIGLVLEANRVLAEESIQGRDVLKERLAAAMP